VQFLGCASLPSRARYGMLRPARSVQSQQSNHSQEASMSASTVSDAPKISELDLDPRDTAIRILLTLLFTIVTSVLNTLLRVLVAFSLLWALITRRAPHPRLRSLANRIISYEYRLNRYITYNDAAVPFPFSDLPRPLEEPTWKGEAETAEAVGLTPRRPRQRDDEPVPREP
jgi:hypothetical protein